MRRLSAALCLAFLGFAAAVLTTRVAYYPALVGYVVVLLGAVYLLRDRPVPALGVFLPSLSAFRVFVYLTTPSMVGMDPDKFAVGVERIATYGSVDAIADLSFYASAPAAHLLAAMTGVLIDVGGRSALVVYPITLTVLPSLTAMGIARRVGRTGLIAGVLTATASVVAAWSLQPIPQLIAVALVTVTLLYFVVLLDNGGEVRVERELLFLVLLVAAGVSHKTPLVFLTWVFLAATVVASNRGRFARVAVIVGSLAVLQSLYVTTFGWGLINVIVLPSVLGAGLSTGTIELLDVSAAEPVLGGLGGGIVKNLHWLLLGAVAGIGWVVSLRRSLRRGESPKARFLLGAGIASGMIAAVSVVGPGVSYLRVLLLAVVPFAVFVELGTDRARGHTTAAVVGLLILVQLTAPMATPDNPYQYRQYLTDEEVEAKQTIGRLTGSVSTDAYYARELSSIRPNRTYITGAGTASFQRGWSALGEPLFSGELRSAEGPIALRDVERYRLIGTWTLTYDPIETLDRSRGRVYTSGDVNLFV